MVTKISVIAVKILYKGMFCIAKILSYKIFKMSNLILILKINGKIINELNEPIENAFIMCDSLTTYSDSLGKFKLNANVPCHMQIKHLNYNDTSFINYQENLIVILKFKNYEIKEQVVISKAGKDEFELKKPTLNNILLNSTISDVEFNPSGLSISINAIPSKFTNIYIDGDLVIGRTFEVIDLSTIPLSSIEAIRFDGLDVYMYTKKKKGFEISFSSNTDYSFNFGYGSEFNFLNVSLSKEVYTYISRYSFYNNWKFKNFLLSTNYNQKTTPFSENFSDFRMNLNFNEFTFQFYNHQYFYKNRVQNSDEEFYLIFKDDYKLVKKWGYFKFGYGFYNDYIRGGNLLNDVNFLRTLISFELYKNFFLRLKFENLEPSFNIEYKNFELFLNTRYPSAKELFMNFKFPELGYKVVGNSNLNNERVGGINVRFFGFQLNYSKIFNYIGFVNIGYNENLITYTYDNIGELEVYSISFEKSINFKNLNFYTSFFIGKTPPDLPPYKFNLKLYYMGFGFLFWLKAKTQIIPSLYSIDLIYYGKFKNFEGELKLEDLFDKTSDVNLPYFVGRKLSITLKFPIDKL